MDLQKYWMWLVRDGVRGVGEVLFPENDLGAPDWRQARLVERAVAWIEELPPPNRQLLTLLFIAIELGGPVLVPGVKRFSHADADRRIEAIRKMRGSSHYLVRVVGDALKAILTMIYMSHPDVLRHVGMYKHCEYPDDPLQVVIKADTLAEEAT